MTDSKPGTARLIAGMQAEIERLRDERDAAERDTATARAERDAANGTIEFLREDVARIADKLVDRATERDLAITALNAAIAGQNRLREERDAAREVTKAVGNGASANRTALHAIAGDLGLSTDDRPDAVAANIRAAIARLSRGAVAVDAAERSIGALTRAIEVLRGIG